MMRGRRLGSYDVVTAVPRAASTAARTVSRPGRSAAPIEPVCRWAAPVGSIAGRLVHDVELVLRRAGGVEHGGRGGRAPRHQRARLEPHPVVLDVRAHRRAVRVVADAGREARHVAEPGQTDRDVERGAARVALRLAVTEGRAVDDVDERLADHQERLLHSRGEVGHAGSLSGRPSTRVAPGRRRSGTMGA
ncbi:hypothetical protein GCM10025868_13530 [Angustibacter aerolatus]|uniref:Uncharacterized protein n=1 Tax=Angustibacter aerolatus TaxID=1162965 RepID=A0ABQ6JF98_9ACTN|nr:hypothetical protein GCM10025868_13530 [Angustibacter aerolatus]